MQKCLDLTLNPNQIQDMLETEIVTKFSVQKGFSPSQNLKFQSQQSPKYLKGVNIFGNELFPFAPNQGSKLNSNQNSHKQTGNKPQTQISKNQNQSGLPAKNSINVRSGTNLNSQVQQNPDESDKSLYKSCYFINSNNKERIRTPFFDTNKKSISTNNPFSGPQQASKSQISHHALQQFQQIQFQPRQHQPPSTLVRLKSQNLSTHLTAKKDNYLKEEDFQFVPLTTERRPTSPQFNALFKNFVFKDSNAIPLKKQMSTQKLASQPQTAPQAQNQRLSGHQVTPNPKNNSKERTSTGQKQTNLSSQKKQLGCNPNNFINLNNFNSFNPSSAEPSGRRSVNEKDRQKSGSNQNNSNNQSATTSKKYQDKIMNLSPFDVNQLRKKSYSREKENKISNRNEIQSQEKIKIQMKKKLDLQISKLDENKTTGKKSQSQVHRKAPSSFHNDSSSPINYSPNKYNSMLNSPPRSQVARKPS